MEITSTQSNSLSRNEVDRASSASAKLRRLKIQENLLLERMHSYKSSVCPSELEVKMINYSSQFKAFLFINKNSLVDIKTLFTNIKECALFKDALDSSDINNIKMDINELDKLIKKTKLYLQTKLNDLKSSERQLNNQLMEIHPSVIKVKKKSKYNKIIPSPVKLIMTSSFKCLEVQAFQEFMKKSSNHYGGWNEYNHNIFTKLWKSHFCPYDSDHLGEFEYFETNNPMLGSFVDQLLLQLKGISREEIIIHIKWYMTYINLKNRQQKAIEKWRSNRELIKKAAKVQQHGKYEDDTEEVRNYEITNHIISDGMTEMDKFHNHPEFLEFLPMITDKSPQLKKDIQFKVSKASNKHARCSNYLSSTKQWRSRCYSEDSIKCFVKMDDIKKLGIPKWRSNL